MIWEARHLGFKQTLASKITALERPGYFQDTMVSGPFKSLVHDHLFTEIDGHTLVVDKLRFSLPLGWPGKIVARRVLVPYLSGVLRRRMMLLRHVAESEEWRRYLPEETE